ncbi:MAG: valine--tRNA ligase, partial [Hyphococcus sp.]
KWETRDYISIATTRPETMLGDGAVAVHPSDKRYAPIVGKRCHIPVGDDNYGKGRLIPIITDDYPDPDFGSGAVKITGAHDFNDYQVAKRNDIPMYVLMDTKARMMSDVDYIPKGYWGLDRYEARDKVVAEIDNKGLMIAVEDKKIMQPFGDRSGVVIEPMLTNQWYVDAKTLAKPAIEAVEQGKTKFVPENWTKTYFQWMRNIEPWCVSRQLWWGHRIPAWYGPDISELGEPQKTTGRIFVAGTEEAAISKAKESYGSEVEVTVTDGMPEAVTKNGEVSAIKLKRDEDVLDTWFSSALWPFSTLGWPALRDASSPHPEGERSERLEGQGEEAPQGEGNVLQKHYPTSVLVTAFDIIFFWVARMMMMGLHFMKEIPFHDVYIHALVLDEHGQKMSKSKGNVIDPLVLIDKYGADALRFTLAAQAAQGRNIRLSENRVEGYRNFSTKLWNAARFCEMNECRPDADFDPAKVTTPLSRWIIHEANQCAAEVTREIEAYRFNDAAGAVYRFAWNVFCDWHLELSKPVLQGDDETAKAETRAATAWAFDQVLKLLHPFMPFVTEELWNSMGARDQHLMVTDWPSFEASLENRDAADEVNWAIGLITSVRSVRAEMNVPAGA